MVGAVVIPPQRTFFEKPKRWSAEEIITPTLKLQRRSTPFKVPLAFDFFFITNNYLFTLLLQRKKGTPQRQLIFSALFET